MPVIKYEVDLTETERQHLLQLLGRGKPSARKVTRAQILLHADEGWSDEQTAQAVHGGLSTVGRVRKRWVEDGLEAALSERPRPGHRPTLTGKQTARLMAEVCTPAPAGHARWTLRLLADRVVELGLVTSISHETVRRVLKKTNSRPGRRSPPATGRRSADPRAGPTGPAGTLRLPRPAPGYLQPVPPLRPGPGLAPGGAD